MNTKKLTRVAIIAAIYAVATVLLAPISYGQIQFRVPEMLILLAALNSDYVWGLTLGCFIANMFSPLGVVDMVFGTSATLLSTVLISRTHNLFIDTLYPAIINGIVVGVELHLLFQMPLILSMLYVAAGEFAVVFILGLPFVKLIKSNRKLMNLIG